MAVKKEGDLRIRKGEQIYGPMTRGDFDRLLAAGRFSLADSISVWGGPWMEVIQFLSPPETTDRAAAKPLRVLQGERLFGSLSHKQVIRLRADGRIGDEDLVCALGGPWMSVADFLSPPRPPEVDLPPQPIEEEEPEPELEYMPLTWYRAYSQHLEDGLSDHWFVRVRGIHSAPLTKLQVHQLIAAEEISDHAVARHWTWPEKQWKPIYEIPELA
ncbi:MAG TPA: hypothetical protein VHC22_27225 [Pirellulales bacterium]|nr:hypothetical protein [Pirellulales bacterium]